MNTQDEKFQFLDAEEIDVVREEQAAEAERNKTICSECANLMMRRVFDGNVEVVTVIECVLTDSVNISEFPVLECTRFSKQS